MATLADGREAIERERSVRDVRTDDHDDGDGDGDGSDVEVRILETNAPVRGGSLLEAAVEVENVGPTRARPGIEFSYEGEYRWTIRTTVEAGESKTIDPIRFRTYPVESDDEVTVGAAVENGGDADERTAVVLAVDPLHPDRTRPDRHLSVRPETSLLFEVLDVERYGGRSQWFVDREHAGASMGPWYGAYYEREGADFWRTSFESPGTHEVAVAVLEDEDEIRRATWSVEVAETGVEPPSIEAIRPDEESLEVSRGEPTELQLDVAHPDGLLDRVVWWLGHADVVLDVTPVSGTTDTATYELESSCHRCPIIVWVVAENGSVASASPWVIDGVDDAPDAELGVTITETNDPVDAGEVLEVSARVENRTDGAITRDAELIVGHDPTLVDRASVTVGGGETETVDLEFETAVVRRTQTFPARVEIGEAADERTVEVIGTGDVGPSVTITGTNSPVRTGEVLEVTAELENPHSSTLTREVQLVVGHDPEVVETRTVTLEPGATETVILEFETALVEHDQEFPVRVETEGDADEVPVFVYVEAPPMLVRILDTNDPVATGDVLEVTAEVENVARSTATRDVDLVVGHDPTLVDTETVTVGGGETRTVVLEFETALVRRTQTFPARVESGDDAAVRDVEVIGTEDLEVDVTITGSNDPVDAGEWLSVTAVVENASDVAVTGEFEFVVGHDPTVEDGATVRLGPGGTTTLEMGFRTAIVENDQTFPVRVESALASDERTVEVRGTDGA
ncbi:hypothetical protein CHINAEXTREME_19820 [Halobiforma lacisalsi AJ5]|uniref:CARDB domain-containing protein n=1 Tax=Natronobacterium lacisalsi AJ5 TaxID=358396 RepID=M0LR10_NATLA|nr:hypothetical protein CHINAEXTREME_19820 [Halobiforma lacisalsi AJ5]EMA35936.1 hypothetical protein C445_03733 [Halobiforma lacisalsi AJ5]